MKDVLNVQNFGAERIIRDIEAKRAKNQQVLNQINKKVDRLMAQGRWEEVEKLTSKDVLGGYPVYAEAEQREKRGDLEGAAKLYWKNIYVNGTDAPANFRRLLITLSKLGEWGNELMVAQVYLQFVRERNRPTLEKRIERLEKRLGKL